MELQDDFSPLTSSDDDLPNRPQHSQKMITLLDKGETDVSCEVEIIEVDADGSESDPFE